MTSIPTFIPTYTHMGEYVYQPEGRMGPGYYLIQTPSSASSLYLAQRGIPASHSQPSQASEGGYPRSGGSGEYGATPTPFYPSPTFQGPFAGYVFKHDVYGQGYYLDAKRF